jgi:hypothetical protein
MKKEQWLLVQEKRAKRKKRHPRNQPSFKHLIRCSQTVLEFIDEWGWYDVQTMTTRIRPVLAGAFHGRRFEVVRQLRRTLSFLKSHGLLVRVNGCPFKHYELQSPLGEFTNLD